MTARKTAAKKTARKTAAPRKRSSKKEEPATVITDRMLSNTSEYISEADIHWKSVSKGLHRQS